MPEDLRATFGVVRAKVVDLSTKLNYIMRAAENQTLFRGVVQFNKVKVPEP